MPARLIVIVGLYRSVIFGDIETFAVEIQPEPGTREFKGFGRMCVWVQGLMLGRIEEANCSLFHAVERIAEVSAGLSEQWDERFAGHSAEEIFAWIDAILYTGEIEEADEGAICRYDFLTNTGEQFDAFKSFVYCDPEGVVCIPFRGPDEILRTPRCRAEEFRAAAVQLEGWFKEHVSP